MTLSGSAITLIILATLVVDFIMTGVADLLNLSNIKPLVPDEFKDLYDKEKYTRSQQYLKTQTQFGTITSLFNLCIVLAFWFAKGFVILDTLVRSWVLGSVATGLCYIGILLLLRGMVSLPFSIYSTFVIEEKFGFNKTTVPLFVADLIKSTLIAAVLGGMLLGGILIFLEFAGPGAWLLCWLASAVFILAFQYIVPTWIMPLFNRFSPLEAGALRDAITKYADSINFSLENIFVMDGSRRSAKSNAFFTGFGKNRRIVLFDTLVAEHDVEGLVAILAHEMGHFKKKHIIRRLVLAIAQMGIIFFLISVCISSQGLFNAFFMDKPSIYAGLVFFGMLFAPVDFFVSMAFQAMSRRDEYEADRFAAETTQDKEAMINALKKLSVHNLSNLSPHPFYVFLNYSHPPVMERILAIRHLSH